MKKICLFAALGLSLIFLAGCQVQAPAANLNVNQPAANVQPSGAQAVPADKFCTADADCQCFSGCACGCWNKNYVPPETGNECRCDAYCLMLPATHNCVCKNNACQEAAGQNQAQAGDEKNSATAGWANYLDDDYGFSLKYPADWKFEKVDTPLTPHFREPDGKCSFNVAAGKASLAAEIANLREKKYQETEIIVGPGIKAVKFDEGAATPGSGGFSWMVYFGPDKDGICYRFSGSTHLADYAATCEAILNNVLASFTE